MSVTENGNAPVETGTVEVPVVVTGDAPLVDYTTLSDEDFVALMDVPSPTNHAPSAEEPAITPVEEPEEIDPTVIPEPEPTVVVETATVDTQAFYDAITAPFQAAGAEVQLTDPADVIRLAQMGIGYSKRMEAMNKDMPMIDALREANVLNADNINMAIELLKGNPAAIKALAQQHNVEIDPLDDSGDTGEYTPDNHLPNAQQLAFTNTLKDIRESNPQFVTELNTDFDDASKQIMFENPGVMGLLLSNKESGVYNTVMKEVKRLSLINHPSIAGQSVLQAYKTVGDALYTPPASGTPTKVDVPTKVPVGTRAGAPPKAEKLPAGVTTPKGGKSPISENPGAIDFSKFSDDEIVAMESKFRI